MFCTTCGSELPPAAKFCPSCGATTQVKKVAQVAPTPGPAIVSLPETAQGAPGKDQWFQSVMERLTSQGYRLTQNQSREGQGFLLVAHRSGFELTKFGNCETFFVFSEFSTLDPRSLQRFSGLAFKYAMDALSFPLIRGLGNSGYCFPVALVEYLDPATASFIRAEAPPKHWAAGELPVVYEYGAGRLHYFEKTPIWGAAYYAGFRTLIKEMLG